MSGEWPAQQLPPLVTITPWSAESIGPTIAAMNGNSIGLTGSAVYPVANTAYFFPFLMIDAFTVVKMFVSNGGTVSGNIDLGIYTENGARLGSTGSTAHTPANGRQEFDVADATLGPGLLYLAVAMDNVTATLSRGRVVAAGNPSALQFCGAAEAAASFPLPNQVTFASITADYVPLIGLTGRSLI